MNGSSSLYDQIFTKAGKKIPENEQKERIHEILGEVSMDDCWKTIGSSKTKLWAVCEQDGGHFEHLFKQINPSVISF